MIDQLQKLKRSIREQENRLEVHLKKMGGDSPSEPSLDKFGVSY